MFQAKDENVTELVLHWNIPTYSLRLFWKPELKDYAYSKNINGILRPKIVVMKYFCETEWQQNPFSLSCKMSGFSYIHVKQM